MKRPVTRADCLGGPRPCPWVSCRHHLYGDTRNGRWRPTSRVEPHEMQHTCSLDIADDGPHTLEEIGDIYGVSRENIRQIEVRALGKLRLGAPELAAHLGIPPQTLTKHERILHAIAAGNSNINLSRARNAARCTPDELFDVLHDLEQMGVIGYRKNGAHAVQIIISWRSKLRRIISQGGTSMPTRHTVTVKDRDISITENQKRIVDAIRDYHEAHDDWPTRELLAKHLGITTNRVAGSLSGGQIRHVVGYAEGVYYLIGEGEPPIVEKKEEQRIHYGPRASNDEERRALLLDALDGLGGSATATQLSAAMGVSMHTVGKWTRRFTDIVEQRGQGKKRRWYRVKRETRDVLPVEKTFTVVPRPKAGDTVTPESNPAPPAVALVETPEATRTIPIAPFSKAAARAVMEGINAAAKLETPKLDSRILSSPREPETFKPTLGRNQREAIRQIEAGDYLAAQFFLGRLLTEDAA